MNIGSLYQTTRYCPLLFPSKESSIAAVEGGPAPAAVLTVPAWVAAHWSKRLDCNISYISSNNMFMLLEQTDNFCKILSAEGNVGWIVVHVWYKKYIVEVKAE